MQRSLLVFPILLMLAEMTAYLSNDMYLPALPNLRQAFGISTQVTQFTLTAWFLGTISLELIIGPISDRFGRRPILILGMILFALSTLGCALTSDIYLFTLGRFIQGSTVCFVLVAGYASIHELFNQKQAIHLLANMNSIIVLAPAFGPLLGGLILIYADWRWTFWPLFLLGLIVLLLLFKWMPESLPLEKRHPLNLKLLIKQYVSILTNRQFMFLLSASGFQFCGFIAWLVSGPFLVIDDFHYSPAVFGILQVIIFGFYILANQQVKLVMDKLGLVRLIQVGLVISVLAGIFAVLAAICFPDSLVGFIINMSLYSFGFGFTSAPLQRVAIEASNQPMGSRMAILSTLFGAGGAAATGLINIFYDGKLISLALVLLIVSVLSYVLSLFAKYQ